MITIQVPTEAEASELYRFAQQFGIHLSEDKKQSMILCENGAVLGYASFMQKGAEGLLDTLIIATEQRGQGFGDGLLRGTLNIMEKNGIAVFYIPGSPALNPFLAAEEITLSDDVPQWIRAHCQESQYYSGRLPDFFEKPCKGGRR